MLATLTFCFTQNRVLVYGSRVRSSLSGLAGTAADSCPSPSEIRLSPQGSRCEHQAWVKLIMYCT